MNITEVKPGIFAVGAIDWNVRAFHGYSTERGATYNAYLVIDDKITLIDTVKEAFTEELIDRIREIIDPAKIDYVISNHVEMDHSGGIPGIMNAAPNASIITSAPSGLKGLKAHYGDTYNYIPVKSGESISLGKRTLTFVATPMLHWPDNMVTYCPEEKLLFSNDAFGQHFASAERFDDQVNLAVVMQEAQKYYANILMPYGQSMKKTLPIVESLDIDMIAPSHGVIWRSHVPDIMKAYAEWCNGCNDRKALVIYDSMWHSTEKMAKAIVEGFAKKGVMVKLYDLKENHISNLVTEVLKAEYIAVGSPTLNGQMMPNVASFLCYLAGLSDKNKKAFAFGSYGWNGTSIQMVHDRLAAIGYEMILDPIRQLYIPSKEQLRDLENKVASIV